MLKFFFCCFIFDRFSENFCKSFCQIGVLGVFKVTHPFLFHFVFILKVDLLVDTAELFRCIRDIIKTQITRRSTSSAAMTQWLGVGLSSKELGFDSRRKGIRPDIAALCQKSNTLHVPTAARRLSVCGVGRVLTVPFELCVCVCTD